MWSILLENKFKTIILNTKVAIKVSSCLILILIPFSLLFSHLLCFYKIKYHQNVNSKVNKHLKKLTLTLIFFLSKSRNIILDSEINYKRYIGNN